MDEKIIELKSGAIAVEACYRNPSKIDHIDKYEGNPLIEALPQINSKEDVVRALSYYPKDTNGYDNLPPEIKIHNVTTVLELFQPNSYHLKLEKKISNAIRNGYIHRNPLTKEYTKDTNIIHETVRDKNFNIKNKLLRPAANGFTIIGMSGTGKSTAINNIISMYPQVIVHSEYKNKIYSANQIVWIKLDCPSKGSIKGLIMSFFAEIDRIFGEKYMKRFIYSSRYNTDSLKKIMIDVAEACNLGVLIIDEVQNLSAAPSGGYEAMLNFFVTLRNEIGIPVILVGTRKAVRVLQSEFSQARRGCDTGDMEWGIMEKDKYWDLLLKMLFTYQWTKEKYIVDEEISNTLYYESQGIVALTIRLYAMAQTEAIVKNHKKISPKIIVKVAKEEFKLLKPMLDALKSGDEKLIAKYCDLGPINIDDFFKEKMNEIEIQEEIKAIEKIQKEMNSKEEKHVKEMAKLKLKDLGINDKVINKYIDKIYMKNSSITVNQLVESVFTEALLSRNKQAKSNENSKKTENKDDFREITRDEEISNYEVLKEKKYIKGVEI